jgi:hypothetical protein
VKRSRRVQLHQFEQRRDASEVKMKRLDEQLEEKKALFQQKRCASHRGVPPPRPAAAMWPPPHAHAIREMSEIMRATEA